MIIYFKNLENSYENIVIIWNCIYNYYYVTKIQIYGGVMELLNGLVETINEYLWGYILIVMLITLGLYFTFRTKFVQFRYFGEMFRLLGDGASKDSKKEGKVSSFQAFCMSTASRVGTGNIAGIAIAIIGGGPGAIFWMWIIALIGSASSFVESTLAQIYKVKDGDSFRGGPAYYIEQGLNKKWLGVTFAVLITISFGFVFNAVQANTVATAFNNAFGLDKMVIGIVLAALTAAVIFGGVHRVAKVSEIIVPIFAVLYILVSLFIVVTNLNYIPGVFKLIFESAFGMREIAMGTMGGMMLTGIKRGLFSNEAGMGSTPHAHAVAKVNHPVEQGFVAMAGVFIDTFIVLNLTALVILTTKSIPTGLTGAELSQYAFSTLYGKGGNVFIAICMFFFAFSTIIGWYFFGQANVKYLFGPKAVKIYSVLAACCVFLGSLAEVELVWNMADCFNSLMVVPNILALFALSKVISQVHEDYFKNFKKKNNS